MKKSAVLMMVLGMALSWTVQANAEPYIKAKTAILMDAYTGEVLWEKDGDKPRAPASTIKMLTCLIALEQKNQEEIVQIGKYGPKAYAGQTIRLNTGDKLTRQDLIEAALIWSANDAAVALGEHLAGDPNLFCLVMKKKAWALGAYNSEFRNPNGYTEPGQYSTARDLGLIGRAAMKNPRFATIVGQKEAEISWLNRKKTITLTNTNHLLSTYTGATGIKTGTTNASGCCLVGAAERNGRKLISVVLGSPQRYADTISLLEYGFNQFAQVVVNKEEVFDWIAVEDQEEKIAVVPRDDIFFTVPLQASHLLETQIQLKRYSTKTQKSGQVMGKVSVFYRGLLVKETELIVP